MLLRELAGVASDSKVTGFALDHRKVAPGNVFGAFRGSRFNGEDFIAEAVKRGAVAVVARPEADVSGVPHLSAGGTATRSTSRASPVCSRWTSRAM